MDSGRAIWGGGGCQGGQDAVKAHISGKVYIHIHTSAVLYPSASFHPVNSCYSENGQRGFP